MRSSSQRRLSPGNADEQHPKRYQDWAQHYYETDIDLAAVRRVFALEPLADELVARLNADRRIAEPAIDIGRIGYPVSAE